METPKEIQEAAEMYAKNEWKDFPHNIGYAQKDFVRGALHPSTEEYYRKKFEAERKTATELTTNKK